MTSIQEAVAESVGPADGDGKIKDAACVASPLKDGRTEAAALSLQSVLFLTEEDAFLAASGGAAGRGNAAFSSNRSAEPRAVPVCLVVDYSIQLGIAWEKPDICSLVFAGAACL